MGGPGIALAVCLLLVPAALALPATSGYPACGGDAPAVLACAFEADVRRAAHAGCINDECLPGAIPIAGGASFTGILVVRADAVDGPGSSSSSFNCALVAGEGACIPDAGTRSWPVISPGLHRVEARVLAGEGKWWVSLTDVP